MFTIVIINNKLQNVKRIFQKDDSFGSRGWRIEPPEGVKERYGEECPLNQK